MSYEWVGGHSSLTPAPSPGDPAGQHVRDQTAWEAASAWAFPHLLSQSEAVEMMDQIVHWVREDPSGLGRPQLPGTPASESMAVPMMLLSLVEQLGEADEELAGNYMELGNWCAQRILQHVQVGAGG